MVVEPALAKVRIICRQELLATMYSVRPSPRFVSWSEVCMTTASCQDQLLLKWQHSQWNWESHTRWYDRTKKESPVFLYVCVFWLWLSLGTDVILTLTGQDRNLSRQYNIEYVTHQHVTMTQNFACTEISIHTHTGLISLMLIPPTPCIQQAYKKTYFKCLHINNCKA